jgi:TonB family protein
MKKAALFLFITLLAVNVFSQKNGWDKLQTDDGEMSLMMPAGCYSNLYDRDGIRVYEPGNRRESYELKEMRLVSCYLDGALLNLEIYETAWAKSAAKILQKQMRIDGGELNLGKKFYAVEQTKRNEIFVLSRRVVGGKNHVYIITAATRGEPNETIKTFLDSVKFEGDDAPTEKDKNSVLISSLVSIAPEVVTKKDVPDDLKPAEDKPLKKMILLSIPTASYTEPARKKRTTGRVSLRLTFSAEGRISRIQVVRDLPDGLLREAVMSALRIKFLPELSDDKPRSVTKLIEYNFGSY